MEPVKVDNQTGAVVSDLHLFTNRTTVHEHIDQIHEAAEHCDLFIFNGDIFDFKWSLHRGFEASVQAAEKWITDLVCSNKNTRFVFILGNHDSIQMYSDTLEAMYRRISNLEWRPYWYRLGDKIFLHGDVCQGGTTSQALDEYRHKCNRNLQRSRFEHLCYWVFARSGLPAFFLQFIRRDKCARRILAYLSNELGPAMDEIREIYFGHVHTAFSDFRYGNYLFHNTGSATKGMRLSVIRFDINSSAENIEEVTA